MLAYCACSCSVTALFWIIHSDQSLVENVVFRSVNLTIIPSYGLTWSFLKIRDPNNHSKLRRKPMVMELLQSFKTPIFQVFHQPEVALGSWCLLHLTRLFWPVPGGSPGHSVPVVVHAWSLVPRTVRDTSYTNRGNGGFLKWGRPQIIRN